MGIHKEMQLKEVVRFGGLCTFMIGEGEGPMDTSGRTNDFER